MVFAKPKEIGDLLDRSKVFHVDVLERQSASDRRLQETNDVNDAEAVDSADFKQESRALECLVTSCLRINDRKLGIDIVEQGLREFLAGADRSRACVASS